MTQFTLIKCPYCESVIAIDEKTIYPIDCDCGQAIRKKDIGKNEREKVVFT